MLRLEKKVHAWMQKELEDLMRVLAKQARVQHYVVGPDMEWLSPTTCSTTTIHLESIDSEDDHVVQAGWATLKAVGGVEANLPALLASKQGLHTPYVDRCLQ